jgi:transcriptional regulator with XRE-family HTH domain
MIATRARECLKVLRWSADDLADELGQSVSDVQAWLEGRAPVPLAVAAWLEALVKLHRSLAPPNLDRCPDSVCQIDMDRPNEPLGALAVRTFAQQPHPRRSLTRDGATTRTVVHPTLMKGPNHA